MSGSLIADLSGRTSLAGTAGSSSLAATTPFPLVRDYLYELETAFARFDGRPETTAAFRAAAERAHALADAAGGGVEAQRSAGLAFAADALAAVAPERTSLNETADGMVSTLSQILEIAPKAAALELFLRATASPALHELPPMLTLDLQLQLLLALAPISDVSLWADSESHQRLTCIAHVGETPSTRRVRHLARSVLDGKQSGSGGEPTVTDATLMLGRIPPHLLGGEIPLDASAAQQGIAALSRRAGGSGGVIVVDALGRFGYACNTSHMSVAYMRRDLPGYVMRS